MQKSILATWLEGSTDDNPYSGYERMTDDEKNALVNKRFNRPSRIVDARTKIIPTQKIVSKVSKLPKTKDPILDRLVAITAMPIITIATNKPTDIWQRYSTLHRARK